MTALSWDARLVETDDPTSLISIGRDRRLVLEDDHKRQWVDLCWVDEVALALIDLTISRGRALDLVYPAPAGQVAVLIAAQLLINGLVRNIPQPSVGIVTADPVLAARTWAALRIATVGDRVPLSSVFPCFRARPDGEIPSSGRHLTGVVIGQRCVGWPVAHLIVDHLSGSVSGLIDEAEVGIYADPLDRHLRTAEERGRLVWGWSGEDLAQWGSIEQRRDHTAPFSVASDRLATMATGVGVTMIVCRQTQAEEAVARVREDLRLLRRLTPGRTERNLERGLSVAWHHLSTLISLPCAPSRFDQFAGMPPFAARATRTFARELDVWAQTLDGDQREIATILASDIGELRACLEEANPLKGALTDLRARVIEPTLMVTRTNTASKALLDMLGVDPERGAAGLLSVCAVGRLHRQGSWPRAVMIGEPSPWDWHRLISGLTSDLEVLVLGERSAAAGVAAVSEVRDARDRWGGTACRSRTWVALLGGEPPPEAALIPGRDRATVLVDGVECEPAPDPFAPLASLFDLDPLEIGGEGPRLGLAREEATGWSATVDAVEILTDKGIILLEAGSPVEVRVGVKVVDKRPEALQAGDAVLVGRHEGRVGLIEALEERLRDRPDLLAARYLIDGYHRQVRLRFTQCGLTVLELHAAMVVLGCTKTSAAVRDWVTNGGMAPQHFDDLERLNTALDLGMSDAHLHELFAGVQRRRGFRRSAGRALAAAARDSTLAEEEDHIDEDTGLSIADLRDTIVQAVVVGVHSCEEPVPYSLLGRLEPQ